MKKKFTLPVIIFFIFLSSSAQAQKVGINVTNPGFALDVYDSANQGIPVFISSKNAATSLLGINGLTSTSMIGTGLYRNGFTKAYAYLDQSNNYNIGVGGSFVSHLCITPSGNIGISQPSPNYPLNFPNTLGDKISLYGNGTNTYGFG